MLVAVMASNAISPDTAKVFDMIIRLFFIICIRIYPLRRICGLLLLQ